MYNNNETIMNKNVNDMDVQGAGNVTEQVKRKPSELATLKRFNETINQMAEIGMLKKEEETALRALSNQKLNKWLGI